MAARWPIPEMTAVRCDGCGLCVRACTNGALALVDGVAVVQQPDACQYDGHCELICPQGAVTRPFAILLHPQTEKRRRK